MLINMEGRHLVGSRVWKILLLVAIFQYEGANAQGRFIIF